jgi:hypothetical protein
MEDNYTDLNHVGSQNGSASASRIDVKVRLDPKTKHTTGGIPRWSPTLVLVARFSAYVWQSGRDAQFSLTYGRMYHDSIYNYYILI